MRGDGVRGHLDLVLLGALATAPGHGYAVISELKRRSGGAIDLAEGSVYPGLHRLEDLGLITSEWTLVGGRRRREYRITDDGRKALAAERSEWRRLADAIDAVVSAKPRRPARTRPIGGIA